MKKQKDTDACVARDESKETASTAAVEVTLFELLEPSIVAVEKLIGNLPELDETALIEGLKSAFKRIESCDFAAKESQLQAELNKWLAGTMLNKKKAELGHGKFGAWRSEHLEAVMSDRTSQRYMKLADDHRDVRAMLEQHCIIPDIAAPGDNSAERPDSPGPQKKTKAGALMSSIIGLHKTLRLFEQSGEQLREKDVTQLRLAKEDLDEFFAKVLAPAGDEPTESEGGLDS